MPDKIALITGASSGFGLLTSIELARAGFRVVATMRELGRRERLDQAASAAGVAAQLDIRALDVTNFSALPPFVDAVVGITPASMSSSTTLDSPSPVSPKISSSKNSATSSRPISSAPSP
jgi:NAD(P)-dependent dehydrogenase (short-subunit alcohol dehydrogenase family)